MKKIIRILTIIIIGLQACKKTPKPLVIENPILLNYTFENDSEGWVYGYSDYPSTLSLNDSLVLYQMLYGYATLPASIVPAQKGLRIKGMNRSDDLFMYVKKNLSGLVPNTLYKITFEVEMASNAPTNAVGVGGAPGEGVTLKAGAKAYEPKNIKDGNNFYRLNIDKANQKITGIDMQILGNIGVADDTRNHTLISRNSASPFLALTNSNGQIWIIIGTDSGYEGLTDLYFSNIKIKLEKQIN
ncbi:MAG: hypothetical protein EAY66_03540 [Sphingobacteriales bacterium]|nr:MAG: hypothetical protein EAY66_03540 [Sphingobacteriales bacterium]